MADLRAYNPSLRDRIAWKIAGGAGNIFGAGKYAQQDIAGKIGGLIDFIPGVGEVLGADDVASSAQAGNWTNAAIGAGALALGTVPIAGDIAAKGLKKLESRVANIYNPPVKSLRPFEADYPSGGLADDAGNLIQDIDGRPISARYVVGRRSVSGPDVPLPPEALDEIAKARTGEAIRSVAPGTPDIGQDMGRAVFRSGGRPDYVAVSKSIAEPNRSRVAAHEIGHVIDQAAGWIPPAGLNDELRGVYNSLNNPQNYGKRFGPEQSRYKGESVQRELMAEAIRAYMTDPNYIKTAAPKVAARVRQAVNTHPALKDLIQFNSLAPIGMTGAGGMAGLASFDPQNGER